MSKAKCKEIYNGFNLTEQSIQVIEHNLNLINEKEDTHFVLHDWGNGWFMSNTQFIFNKGDKIQIELEISDADHTFDPRISCVVVDTSYQLLAPDDGFACERELYYNVTIELADSDKVGVELWPDLCGRIRKKRKEPQED